jgi:hypothetical protein
MLFHALFDFFTYQILATGDARIIAYAVRGTLMTILGVYLLLKLRQRVGEDAVRVLTVDEARQTPSPLVA